MKRSVVLALMIAALSVIAQDGGLLVGDPISFTVTISKCDSVGVAEAPDEWVSFLPLNSKKASLGGEFTFQAAVYDTGTRTVPPLGLVLFRGNVPAETVWTESRVVTVSSSLADTASAPRPLKPYAEHPLRFLDVWRMSWPWLIVALVLAALVFAWLKWFRKKPIHAEIPAAPPLPPYELAVRELIALRDKKYPQRGLLKEHFSEWSEVLRRYVEGRYGFAALEMTTYDLDREFDRDGLPCCLKSELLPVLRESDMVKFAKEIPSLERCDEVLEIGFRIIETTKPPIETQQESKAA